MILVLPDALYYAIAHALGLLPHPYLISPGQMDLMEGRRSMVHWHYKTFYEVSRILVIVISISIVIVYIVL